MIDKTMDHTKDEVLRLFMEKLSGDLSPEDGMALDRLLSADPALKAYWDSLEEEASSLDIEGFLQSVNAKDSLAGLKERIVERVGQPASTMSIRRALSIAAIFLILLGSGWFFINRTWPLLFHKNILTGKEQISALVCSNRQSVTILLSNGQSVNLDKAGVGEPISAGGATLYPDSNTLRYTWGSEPGTSGNELGRSGDGPGVSGNGAGTLGTGAAGNRSGDSGSRPGTSGNGGRVAGNEAGGAGNGPGALGGRRGDTAQNILSVPAGANYKIVLSDGTEVFLNAATRLRFPFRFTGARREVYLEGEAYFKVAADARRPFIVRTPLTAIDVLGTSFDVNSYETGRVRTSLVEGKVVARSNDGRSMPLQPGFAAEFRAADGFSSERFDAEDELSWINGVYYFHDMPITKLVDLASRCYGMPIVIDRDKFAGKSLTGVLDKERLSDFLSDLETTAHLHYYYEGRRLYLK